MSRLKSNYSAVVSTLALVVALTGVGAYAAGVMPDSVGPRQLREGAVMSSKIRDGNVKAADLGDAAVRSKALGSGSVTSPTIAKGAVTADSLTLPAPVSMSLEQSTTANFDSTDALLATIGTYDKQDASSVLRVDWNGTTETGAGSCVLQLRVDGQPASPTAGAVFIQNGGQTLSVATSAQFSGLGVGSHSIEIWAHTVNSGTNAYPCTLSPASTGIGQTVDVSEIVG